MLIYIKSRLFASNMLSYNIVKVIIFSLFFLVISAFVQIKPVSAADSIPLGVHVLAPEELEAAKSLTQVSSDDDRWTYVTVPFTLEDVGQKKRWQKFFSQAKKLKVIPIVRLATKVEGDSWKVPTYFDVSSQITFLNSLKWPTSKKHIIVYNEVNHAKEWGGKLAPREYARIFAFASQWAHAESDKFVVLPAAMDLAAPNGSETMEAFNYLEQMRAYDKEIFEHADAWNSHSYPNPGFASSPERTGKNSLRGFLHELEYLSDKTDRDLPVYITETGWEASGRLQAWLPSYYTYAMQHVWNHPQVVAVTPFLLKGAPGPFAGFSFLTESDEPTAHYQAYRSAVEKVFGEEGVAQLSKN